MSLDENEFFRQATLRICSSLNLNTALERCLEYLKDFIPADGAIMGYYNPDINQARMVASAWPSYRFNTPESVFLPPELQPKFKERWDNTPGIEIENFPKDELPQAHGILPLLTPLKKASHLGMDLMLESERIGHFSLFAEGHDRFSKNHDRLLHLLNEPFAVAMNNSLQHQEVLRLKDLLADDNRYLHRRLMEASGDTIIGADFGLRRVMEMVRQVAHLDSPVLLYGETGVGKEVIANAIHYSSSRRGGPFIKMNCGAIPESLVDAELFGHEKGAFTGAVAMKRGRFERADGGTIFLDEVGELPSAAQVRLLRVLQQREIERVGGTATIPIDVRIIGATHRSLEDLVKEDRFREDLMYRLNVFPIVIPPLRQRTEDIPALVSHFIERKSKDLKIRNRLVLAPGAMDRLQSHHWPGNVRELENLVERALIQSQAVPDGGHLLFGGLPGGSGPSVRPLAADTDIGLAPLDAVMAGHIQKALNHAGGRVEGRDGAAAILGLHPSTLRARMRKLGIPHGRNVKY